MNLIQAKENKQPRSRTSLAIATLMAFFAMATAKAAVPVDQSPLTVKESLPPNIVLMLDDSGSMAWNFMPDWGYLQNNNNNDALINASNNGVYYNPSITYTPPPLADGSGNYPQSPGLTQAWVDGFASSKSPVDLTDYDGSHEKKTCSGGGVCNGSAISFSTSLIVSDTGNPQSQTYSNVSSSTCTSRYNNTAGAYDRLYNSKNSSCTIYYYPQITYRYFQYSTGTAAGPYNVHYVASTDCGGRSNCVLASDTSGTAAPSGVAAGTNIANWFAYYHTRLLAAKSGLMNAFSTLDPTIRVGFGSINGNNNSGLPGAKGSYSSTTVAHVQPIGDGTDNSHKASFWSWIVGTKPDGGTPLRQSLNSAGQYYMQAQPWQTSSTDTTRLACRQAYTILTSDGFWNDSSVSIPANDYKDNIDGAPGATSTETTTSSYNATFSCPVGYTPGTGNNVGKCRRNSNGNYANNGTWSCPSGGSYQANHQNSRNQCVVTTTETVTAAAVTRTGPNNQSYTYSASAPYADDRANTLADVAMYYWLSDLQPDLDNMVPTSSSDPAFWQHMSTFTLGLGFAPTNISPSGTTVDQIFNWANGGPAIQNFSWPAPSSNSINNIADLAHAGLNGHGGFYSAASPQEFSGALEDALKRVLERVGTGASLAANSTELQTGTVTYQALYYTGLWRGDLRAYAVDPNSGVIATTPTWSASSQLPAAASRNIRTYNPTANANARFVQLNGSAYAALSAAQKTAIGSQSMIDYLRGDAGNEVRNGGSFRNRSTALGDIISSQPVYIGAPDANLFYNKTFNGSDAYPDFATAQAGRDGTVWVAGNDGMLHAFSAATGTERFAYLPGAVITGNGVATSQIRSLSEPSYGSASVPHQFFNDGELTVADVYLTSGNNGSWRTVLIGTTGRGPAKAIYALDITSPAAPTLLWERSALDDLENSNYIGQIAGKPVIAQTGDGTWSVLTGNGYNSSSDKAALLRFDLKTGALSVHATDNTTQNGLAPLAVWMADATNGISTVAYAGDLKGRVWSFDLATAGSGGTLMYTALDADDNAQPITGGMLAGQDPDTGYRWLFFGTGRYLTQSDLADTSVQSWYGLIVDAGGATSLVSNLSNGRNALRQRQITTEVAPTTGENPTLGSRAVSASSSGDMAGKSGWYLDLRPPTGADRGERMVTVNQFQGNLLLGTTRVPVSADPCNPSGSGWIMSLNPFTGSNPSDVFFDLNGDGVFDDKDKITAGGKKIPAAGVGFTSIPNNPIFTGNTMLISFDNATTASINTAGTVGALRRLSWRELIAQ